LFHNTLVCRNSRSRDDHARRDEAIVAAGLAENLSVFLIHGPNRSSRKLLTLEEALENFGGCAVIISHDRWFLDRVCTHILAFEGDSQVFWFEGGFSEYEENKRKRLGEDIPHRIKYKKLVK